MAKELSGAWASLTVALNACIQVLYIAAMTESLALNSL